jgi:7-cyano-7-deazaguanine synthase
MNDLLPDAKGAVVTVSGGMDSTIAMRLAVEKYGMDNVFALTFYYGQKQDAEIECASWSTTLLGVRHKIIDMSFLGDISQGFSANVDKNIDMPTIEDVIGDPRPKTYVPNRNMILLSIAAAFAETKKVGVVICGLQQNDTYNYHDTTPRFLEKMNAVLNENRIIQIKVVSPFIDKTKTDEINILLSMDGNVNLLSHTLTCYNPDWSGRSCGHCPSCSERLKAFTNVGIIDPVRYSCAR